MFYILLKFNFFELEMNIPTDSLSLSLNIIRSISRNDFRGHNNSFIYILTTNKYETEKIYKIGYSYDVAKRVKEINYTVNDEDDRFYCVLYLYFPNCLINRVEKTHHKLFRCYKTEWELFQGDLNEFIRVICCLYDLIFLT